MCLIVFAWKQSADTPLLLAANRDEFYARPTLAASWWKEAPHVYAGKDLEAGGTWMGINKHAALLRLPIYAMVKEKKVAHLRAGK